MKHELGRPNKTAADLQEEKPGRVRPYLLVQDSTLTWLESRGAGSRQRGAMLVSLLRDRYELAPRKRPVLKVDTEREGPEPLRPFLPTELLAALDAERGGATRGQMVDAIVAAQAGHSAPNRSSVKR